MYYPLNAKYDIYYEHIILHISNMCYILVSNLVIQLDVGMCGN